LVLGAAPADGIGTDAPEVGTDAETVDLSGLEVVPYDDGMHAVPLRGEQPHWVTDELLAEVAASDEPVAAPPDAPLPGTVGIRPGSWMVAPHGCTMNFVFDRGGDLAIGTAGHCVDRVGDSVVLLTVAPDGGNPVLVEIGPVLTLRDNGVGDDFALVDIPEERYDWVSPTQAVVGGPCGVYPGGLDSVAHYGHGVGIGTGGTPRAGVATHWEDDAYGWAGAAIFGDSGSAVRVTDLRAAGNLTHLVVHPNWLPAFIAGTTIQKMLQVASGYDLALSSICPLGSDTSGSDGGSASGPPEGRGGPPEGRGNGLR
jgi:hypothetical protein